MIRGVDHVGVAVRSLDAGLRVWRDRLGLRAGEVEVVAGQGVRTCFLPAGELRVELLEPTGPDTPVGRFLARRGPGLHHLCLRVDDLQAALAVLAAAGVRLVDAAPRRGADGSRVAFLHPEAGGGVLLELKEAGGG
jgi:methylmalonyl-CoA/ethylmalonyl-CoA epimerase